MATTGNDDRYCLTDDAIRDPPRSLWRALLQIGPGIVLAGSIIGSGELLLTTALGAQYGFVFLWLILFSCVIKVFVQIELGRYAISSGLPTLSALDALPGPRVGAHWLVWWWFVMTLATVFQLGAMVGGVGQALNLAFPAVSTWLIALLGGAWPALAGEIQGRPESPWAVLTALAAVLLLLSGGYRRIEIITTVLVAGVTATTVVCVALLPVVGFPVTIGNIREGFSLGVFALPAAAVAAAFGTFGITGVGASELYAYPYWCLEKGYARSTGPRTADAAWERRARGWLRVMILDSWVSMVVFTVATVAFYTLGATVLHRQNLHPQGTAMIATLSQMYEPAFGAWTRIVFLIGVWAVLFKTLYVASAANSRLATDFLGLTRAVKLAGDANRTRWVRRFCVFFPLLALTLYLIWKDPKLMVVIGGFFQAATLPIIAGAALYLRYFRLDPRLTPSRWSDVLLWFAFLSITIVAAYAIPRWAMNDFWPTVSGWWLSSIRGL